MPDTVQLAWAVDFLDSPADGLEFRYWSGQGPLTIGAGSDQIEYQGTNGVITVDPPREASGEAVRMSIEMDATDHAVRQQLRHDIGPLRVRVRWLYYNILNLTEISSTLRSAGGTYTQSSIFPATDASRTWSLGDVWKARFENTGGSTAVNTTTDYYIRVCNPWAGSNWVSIAVFDTKANADAGTNGSFDNNAGRIALRQGSYSTTDVALRVIERDAVVGEGQWTFTGKEFTGRLSSPVLEGARYTVDIESLISDIDRGRALNWSNDMQQGRYPGDKGMEYIKDYSEGIDTKWPP